jgi:hypothetical protein
MATKKEKALVRELVELALEVNEQGRYDVHVEIRAGAIDFQISPADWAGNWVFYGEDTAYFSRDPWTEDDFAKRIAVFIYETKKRHAGYDDDGIKLFGDEVAE